MEMARMDLTLNEISQLEDLVINEEYYLAINHIAELPDPENPDGTKEKVLRFRYPNADQLSKANRLKQSVFWEMRKDTNLKDQREVEKEFKKEITEIKKALEPLKKEHENLQVELQKRKGELKNPETEPDQFDDTFEKLTKPIYEIITKINAEHAKLEQIYSLSTDYLVMKEYYAILTSMCWMKQGDVEDSWVPIWKSYEEFKQDYKPLATFLMNKTTAFFSGDGSFFGA
jgi:ATP-dependent Lon protease